MTWLLRGLLVTALLGAAALTGAEPGGRLLLAIGQPRAAALVLRDPAWRGVALYRAGRYAEAERVLRETRSPEAAYNLGNALARSGRLAAAVKAYDLALRRNPEDADARANRRLVLAVLDGNAPATPAKDSGVAAASAQKELSQDNLAGDGADTPPSTGDGMAGQREAAGSSSKAGSSRVDRRGTPTAGDSEAGLSSSKGAASDSAGRSGRGGGQTTGARSDAPPGPRGEAADPREQASAQWLASLPDDPARFLRLRIAAEHQRRLAAGRAAAEGTP